MKVYVRLGVGLAQLVQNPHLVLVLEEEATITQLLDQLRTEHPRLATRLDAAVPMIAGRHTTPAQRLTAGQEVALLLPVAGGLR